MSGLGYNVWRTSVCVCVWGRETGHAVRFAAFALRQAPPGGVRNSHGYGSARRREEWISDVGFGEAQLWGSGTERLRHRSEADASASAIIALSGGPLWNFTLWKADKSSFLLTNPSRHTPQRVPVLLLLFHIHSHFPHMALCVVYLFLRLCMASSLSISLYLYMNLFSPTGLPLFSVTLDSVVWLVASKGGFLVLSGKNKLGKWDNEKELWKNKA